jgi:hypothetical protein
LCDNPKDEDLTTTWRKTEIRRIWQWQ